MRMCIILVLNVHVSYVKNERQICVQCNVNVCKRSYYVGLLNGNREG